MPPFTSSVYFHRWIVASKNSSWSLDRAHEPKIIALPTLMINQAREVFWRFPASLIYVLIVSPWPSVPSTLMPLPFRRDRSRHRTAPMFLLVSGREGNTGSGSLGSLRIHREALLSETSKPSLSSSP